VQLSLAPLDAARLTDPERMALSGEGRLAGRLVDCDLGPDGTDEILGRLGSVLNLSGGAPWLTIASSFGQVGSAWDELRVALLPVVDTATLDRVGPDATGALCAAGLAGARWSFESPAPSSRTCAALAGGKRLIINERNPDWPGVVSAQKDLRMLLDWNGAGATLPDLPDSTLRPRVLLALRVKGMADSVTVRAALARWGDQRLHLNLASGLEAGVDDRESLRFIAWLRQEKWSAETIESVLGGNLRKF
jgi:hypothetical protein